MLFTISRTEKVWKQVECTGKDAFPWCYAPCCWDGMMRALHHHYRLQLFNTAPLCHLPLCRNYMLWNSCFILLSSWSLLAVLQQQWLWDVNVNECLSCSFRTCLRIDLQLTLFPCEPSKHDPSLSQAILPSPHWWVSELLKFQSPDALQQWPGLSFAHL